MTPRPDVPRWVRAKITEFERAVREDAWKGAQHPEDHRAIEEHLESARYDLEATIQTALTKAQKGELK
jgi:hypothetical protein